MVWSALVKAPTTASMRKLSRMDINNRQDPQALQPFGMAHDLGTIGFAGSGGDNKVVLWLALSTQNVVQPHFGGQGSA